MTEFNTKFSGVDLHEDFHSKYKFMENSWINLNCYWNSRIKKTVAVYLNLYFFYVEWKEIY